ncbi:MAG: hypothetical protein EXR71_07855 [Myxococcales bacterium]|nr:hypothetical protein [Myxococcales bacterium]
MLISLFVLGCATSDTGDTSVVDTGEPADTGETGETGDTGPFNTPPSTPSIAFTPAVPAPAVAFAVILQTASTDADGDDVTYRYAWTQNGTVVPDLVESTIPAERSVLGETWVVEVTPTDGKDDGIAAVSTVTVGNGAPSAPGLAFSPEEPIEGDEIVLTIDPAAVDPDGDPITTTITWTKNGTPVDWFDGLTVISKRWVSDQDVFEVTVAVTDGLHDPVLAVATVTARYTCANPPAEALEDNTLADARAYHGIGFDDIDGTLIGWDGSSFIKSEYTGARRVFAPGIYNVEQMDRLPDGDWAYGDNSSGTLMRLGPGGATSIIASGLGYIYGVTVGPDGMVYVTYGSVTRVDPDTGASEVVLSGVAGETAHAVNFNLDSTVMYIATIGSGTVYEMDLDSALNATSVPRAFASGMGSWMDGLELDECGNLYVPNYSNSVLWRISPDGSTNTRMVTANPTYYGHGVTWGNGVGDWDAKTLYQPQPYNDFGVREVRIGFASGDTVRTWNGSPTPW